jgi:ATP:ADP antiporter, AAA family
VKDRLEPKRERGERIIAQKVDLDYTKLVFDTVGSKDRSDVLYLMNIFDLIKRDKLTPEVKRLISQRSGELRAASLGTMFEQVETGLGPSIEEEWDNDVLKQDIQEIMELDVYQEVMKAHIGQTLQRGGPEGEVERMEAAKAIGFMSARAPAAEWLGDLIQDNSVEVSSLAIRSAAVLNRRQDVPALVQALKRPALREDAAEALDKHGAKIIGSLADYLHDPSEPAEVRRAAAVVLSHLGTQEAAEFLIWELAPGAGPFDADIIDGLDMIRDKNPKVRFPLEIIKAKILEEARAGCRRLVEAFDGLGTLGPDPGQVTAAMKDDERLRTIFQLLGLIYPHDDIAKAYQNFQFGTRYSIAYAVELLDTVLDKELRDAVFPLIEDIPLEKRLSLCRGQAELEAASRKTG